MGVRAGIAGYTAYCTRYYYNFSAFVACYSIPEAVVEDKGCEKMFEVSSTGQPSNGMESLH